MTTKFLGTSDDGGDPTDGTLHILGATLSANNLLANMPVKTNGSRNLVSSKLELSDVNNLESKIQTYDTKTFYIDNTLSIGSTKFNSDVVADSFIVNNGPNPPLYMKTDGTATNINDNAYIILNSDPFNTFSNITDSLGDVFYNTNSSSLFGFQPPFRDEPVERTPAAFTYTNFNVANETEFNNALASEIPPQNEIQITVTADITFTSTKVISPAIKITSDTGSRMITYSSATSIITFTGDNQIIQGVYFTNSNSGSSATCIAFTNATAQNNFVINCHFTTNEFAITTINAQIQITDNYFWWTASGDSHRYIALYKNTGNTVVARNTFQGNPTFNTACMLISTVSGSSFVRGKFSFKNNNTPINYPVQRLCISDSSFGVNDDVQFYIHDNIISSSSGFMIFYNSVPMTGVLRIVAYNNIERLGGTAIGSKGIIACDNISSTTLPSRTGTPYITTFNNIQPALRTDYTGWTSDNNVAYNNIVISASGNTPKLYSAVLQDIIGADSSDKTANINLPLEANGTRFLNNVYADKFIIQGGPSPAGYLMSDGTILNASSSNINSNIYLYNNNLTTTAPPGSAQIRFNNAVNQNATEVYISHLTRDSIDVDPFLSLITQLSILYIQDQDNSANYVKYNVNTTPTITPNSYVTVSVTFLEGNGTGLTNFPAGMNIFLSIFSNDVEIDTRISNVETKTQNLTATSSDSTFSKTLKMGNNRIQTVGAPVDVGDAVNKSYADGKLSLSGGGVVSGAITANNFIIPLGSSGQFLKADGSLDNGGYVNKNGTISMTGALNMGSQNITNAGTITGNTIVKSGGTATQFLMANGDSNSNIYPQITNGSFNLLWTGSTGGSSTTQSVSVTYKLVSDGTDKIVFLRFGNVAVTQGTTVQNFISATGLPAELIPTGAGINNYVPFTAAGTNMAGLFTIFAPSGLINLKRSDAANLVAGSAYGTSGISCVSYFI